MIAAKESRRAAVAPAKFAPKTDAALAIAANLEKSLDDPEIIGVYLAKAYLPNKLDMLVNAALRSFQRRSRQRFCPIRGRDFAVKALADACRVGVEARVYKAGAVGMKAEFDFRTDATLIFPASASQQLVLVFDAMIEKE